MTFPSVQSSLRAVVAGVVLLVLALIFFGAVAAVWLAATGSSHRPPSVVLLVSSVGFIVILPILRRRLDRAVNRVVFGRRADGYELVAELVGRMTNGLSVDDVMPRLAEAAARTAHRSRGEVTIDMGDGTAQRQVWPLQSDENRPALFVPVRHAGATIGALGVDANEMGESDRRRLDDLARPAGSALTAVRLTVELRRRLAEVESLNLALQASQQRLISARRVERDRIRVQADRAVIPHLDALAAHLDDPPTACEDATAALGALRRLSRSIFSTVLADFGLAPALRAWADEADVPVAVSIVGDLHTLRAWPAVETALHVACVTVLDEWARPAKVVIEVGSTDAAVTVPWDIETMTASLLGQLLRDRTHALGGSLSVDDSAGTLTVRLPFVWSPPSTVGGS